jgi:hypothetical protein
MPVINYRIEVIGTKSDMRRIRVEGEANGLTFEMGSFPLAFTAPDSDKNTMIEIIVNNYRLAHPRHTFVWKQ